MPSEPGFLKIASEPGFLQIPTNFRTDCGNSGPQVSVTWDSSAWFATPASGPLSVARV